MFQSHAAPLALRRQVLQYLTPCGATRGVGGAVVGPADVGGVAPPARRRASWPSAAAANLADCDTQLTHRVHFLTNDWAQKHNLR